MKYFRNNPIKLKNIELIVYFFIWMLLFCFPFFQNRHFDVVDWNRVTLEWIRIASFMVIFAVNAYFILPRFLFLKKYGWYFFSSLITIFLLVWAGMLLQQWLKSMQPVNMPPMNLGPGMPPMELGSKMPPPMGYIPPPPPTDQKSLLMIFIDNTLIAILILAAGTAIRLFSQWLNEEGRRKDIEKEQLKTELALLRHQVSPHFFMNTLNNIHALVDINTETAKDAIIRLSTLMRYLLYDTAQGQTSLKKEIQFIESYIALMQLRFSSKVSIRVELPDAIPDIQIPPMLYISFIENAFKHGVSYQADSFVYFRLEIAGNLLKCSIKNSKQHGHETREMNYSGIGLTNIRKSLSLLFEKNYLLNIIENENEFEIQLTIPVYENKMHSY